MSKQELDDDDGDGSDLLDSFQLREFQWSLKRGVTWSEWGQGRSLIRKSTWLLAISPLEEFGPPLKWNGHSSEQASGCFNPVRAMRHGRRLPVDGSGVRALARRRVISIRVRAILAAETVRVATCCCCCWRRRADRFKFAHLSAGEHCSGSGRATGRSAQLFRGLN